MPAIRLVALDLDGTLLDPSHRIPAATLAAIRAARARGVRFTLVTGRMYVSAAPYAAELGLEGMPLITYNGALVREFPGGADLLHRPLPAAVARAVAAWAEERGHYIQAYQDDRLYVPALVPEALSYSRHARVPVHPVGPISSWVAGPVTKMLLVLPPERMDAVRTELLGRFAGQVECVRSYRTFLEVMAPGVSKGAALAAVAARLGIRREQVLAVGDDMNDLTMLEWAGLGAAMGHAPAEVRTAARFVATAGPGHGVAEVLTHFGLADAG